MLSKIKIIVKPFIVLSLVSTTIVADTNKYYVGISSGYNNIKSDTSNALTTNTLDSSGYNFVGELGYKLQENLNISLNYQRVLNDSISLDNYYIASEYTITKYKSLTPYIGVSLGYSELSWEQNPVNLAKQDLLSSSYLVGATIGTEYWLNDTFALNINYNLQYMNKHTTKIQSVTQNGEIEHKLSHNLNFGIRYFF